MKKKYHASHRAQYLSYSSMNRLMGLVEFLFSFTKLHLFCLTSLSGKILLEYVYFGIANIE